VVDVLVYWEVCVCCLLCGVLHVSKRWCDVCVVGGVVGGEDVRVWL